jgi:hypothetical protein
MSPFPLWKADFQAGRKPWRRVVTDGDDDPFEYNFNYAGLYQPLGGIMIHNALGQRANDILTGLHSEVY